MTERELRDLKAVKATVEKVARDLEEVRERVEVVETEQDIVKHIPGAVAEKIGELKGTVDTMQRLMLQRFDGVDQGVRKASSWDTWLKISVSLVLPILLALIGGYFALKAGTALPSK